MTRAGVFTAVSQGQYLLWEQNIQKLRELARQPPTRYADTVAGFENASNGMAALAAIRDAGVEPRGIEAAYCGHVFQGMAMGQRVLAHIGLAGIPARRGRYLRPLLAARRADVEAYLAAHALPALADPMNEDESITRNRARRRDNASADEMAALFAAAGLTEVASQRYVDEKVGPAGTVRRGERLIAVLAPRALSDSGAHQ